MFEFKKLAYIDLQKTGSTTVINVLKHYLDDEKIYKQTHGPIPRHYKPDKLTFISVREPLSLYTSLFHYGAAEKKGQLYSKLMKQGYPGLYEPTIRGFERWIEFVTDPTKAKTVNSNYARYALRHDIGLLSYRLLYMSIPDYGSALKMLEPGKRNLRKLLKQKRAYSDYVRTECLGVDLFAFFKKHERFLSFVYPLTTASELLDLVPTLNKSAKIEGADPNKISKELRDRVVEREWLIYEAFGYKDNPNGIPSDQNPRLKLKRQL